MSDRGCHIVTDCPFNRANCPELIGKRYEKNPPSYVSVRYERDLQAETEQMVSDACDAEECFSVDELEEFAEQQRN